MSTYKRFVAGCSRPMFCTRVANSSILKDSKKQRLGVERDLSAKCMSHALLTAMRGFLGQCMKMFERSEMTPTWSSRLQLRTRTCHINHLPQCLSFPVSRLECSNCVIVSNGNDVKTSGNAARLSTRTAFK